MARLPVPGADLDGWGDVLNGYLGVEHNPDGTHNAPANHIGVTPSGLILSTNVQAALEEVAARQATGPAGGDLTGSFPAPQLAAGVVTDAKVSNAAAIAESKLALATDAAAGTGSRRTLGPAPTQAAQGDQTRLGRKFVTPAGTQTAAVTNTTPIDLATGLGLAAGALDITFTLTQTTDVIARFNLLAQMFSAGGAGIVFIKNTGTNTIVTNGSSWVTQLVGLMRCAPSAIMAGVVAGTYTWRPQIGSFDATHTFQVWAGTALSGLGPAGWEVFAA